MKKAQLLTFILTCIIFSTYGQFTFDTCLVAYYPFNGSANDESINENNGIIYGPTLVQDRFGNDSSAYSFDGIDDYIQINNDSTLNPENITISLWYKTVSFVGQGNNPLIDKPFSSHTEPYYQYHIGVIGDYSGQSYYRYQTDLSIDSLRIKHRTNNGFWEIDSWYFLCVTFDGSYFTTYINGELFDTTYNPGQISNYGHDIFIGKFGNIDFYTPGIIDDIRLYSSALNSTYVQELYHEGLTQINKSNFDPIVFVYPNPTNSLIIIKSEIEIGKISLSNLTGRRVIDCINGIDKIDISNLPDGLYYLSIYNEYNVLIKTEKIIKI